MTALTIIYKVAGVADSGFSQGVLTGSEPYALPPLIGFSIATILIVVLVLALAYNVHIYRPPEMSHPGGETLRESPPEHE
jgi:hypothetical protein